MQQTGVRDVAVTGQVELPQLVLMEGKENIKSFINLGSYLRIVYQHLNGVVGEILVVNQDHLLQLRQPSEVLEPASSSSSP